MLPAAKNTSPSKLPKLPDQVRAVIRTKHYRMRTEATYFHWIKRFIFFHPDRYSQEMGERTTNQRFVAPGEPGSKKWQKKYGDKLVCVRYKFDAATKKRGTTIELIVAEQD